MTENDLKQLQQYGAQFAGDDDDLTDERVPYVPCRVLALSEIPLDDTEPLPDTRLIEALARIEKLEAALRPFAESGLFFRIEARDKDARTLRSYSGTFMTEMVNPLDALKVVNFRQALHAMKDEFS